MAATREEEQRRRAESRERRRAEGSDESAVPHDGASEQSPEPSDGQTTLKHAALTAVAGAVAAGLAGAGKAWLDRRSTEAEAQGDDDASDVGSGPETAESPSEPPTAGPEAAAEAEADERDEDTSAVEDEGDDRDLQAAEDVDEGPQAAEAAGDAGEDEDDEEHEEDEARVEEEEPEHEPLAERGASTEEPDQEPEPEEEREAEAEPQPTSMREASSIAEAARSQLEQLLGAEAEGVTGFEHSDGHWAVTVEVVEFHRIPPSMDVIASYEVVLDDDRNLVSVDRKRRYRRAQVEEDA